MTKNDLRRWYSKNAQRSKKWSHTLNQMLIEAHENGHENAVRLHKIEIWLEQYAIELPEDLRRPERPDDEAFETIEVPFDELGL